MKTSILFLIILLILTFSVRVFYIGERALGVDEGWTIEIAQSYGAAWDFSASNYYPPLSFFPLVPLLGFCGVLGTRIAFALLATLSVWVFYLLALRYFSWREALVASTLFAFNPLFVFYSVHLRHYMPLMFLFLVLFYLFLRLVERFSFGRAALFSVVCSVMVYFHYISWVYIAGFFLYVLVFLRKRTDFWKYAGMFLVPVVLFLPIVPLAFSQFLHYSESAYFSSGVSFGVLGYFYAFYKFAVGVNISGVPAFIPLLFPFVAGLLLVALLGFYRFARDKKDAGLIAVFVFGCSLALFFIGSLKSSMLFGSRYLFPLMPLFSLFLAGGVFRFKGFARWLLVGLVLAGWLMAIVYFWQVSCLGDWNVFVGL